jgi:hypothetical protein
MYNGALKLSATLDYTHKRCALQVTDAGKYRHCQDDEAGVSKYSLPDLPSLVNNKKEKSHTKRRSLHKNHECCCCSTTPEKHAHKTTKQENNPKNNPARRKQNKHIGSEEPDRYL